MRWYYKIVKIENVFLKRMIVLNFTVKIISTHKEEKMKRIFRKAIVYFTVLAVLISNVSISSVKAMEKVMKES